MAKLIKKLRGKQQVKKKKATYFLPEILLEKLDKFAEEFGYQKRKSEMVALLLEYSFEQLEKELKKDKQPKREVEGEELREAFYNFLRPNDRFKDDNRNF